ncbi:unnamed protein product [Calicophoron daubneyi]|uniref:ISXO2-like transposase domain-containing protein n=1 Tax=Calicophoron daubneyi TaxID=300641 RepID=A0AAV2TV86_CALDB
MWRVTSFSIWTCQFLGRSVYKESFDDTSAEEPVRAHVVRQQANQIFDQSSGLGMRAGPSVIRIERVLPAHPIIVSGSGMNTYQQPAAGRSKRKPVVPSTLMLDERATDYDRGLLRTGVSASFKRDLVEQDMAAFQDRISGYSRPTTEEVVPAKPKRKSARQDDNDPDYEPPVHFKPKRQPARRVRYEDEFDGTPTPRKRKHISNSPVQSKHDSYATQRVVPPPPPPPPLPQSVPEPFIPSREPTFEKEAPVHATPVQLTSRRKIIERAVVTVFGGKQPHRASLPVSSDRAVVTVFSEEQPPPPQPTPSTSQPTKKPKRRIPAREFTLAQEDYSHCPEARRRSYRRRNYGSQLKRAAAQRSPPTEQLVEEHPDVAIRVLGSPAYMVSEIPTEQVMVDGDFNLIELETPTKEKALKPPSKMTIVRQEKFSRMQNRLQSGLVETLRIGEADPSTLEGGNRTKATAICEEVFSCRDDWLNEPSLRLMDFFHLLKDDARLLCWLAKRRLIANRAKCSRANCSQNLFLIQCPSDLDGWVWKCDKCGCSRSLRHRTIFTHCDLTIKTATKILFLWSVGHPNELISFDTDTSQKEASEWLYCIREVCRETNADLKERIGGVECDDTDPGYCRVVEIDEALFSCWLRGDQSGDCMRKVWLLGGAERGTERIFLARCPQNNRDAFSLIPIIREFVKPGTAIITDEWEGYAPLNQLPEGYQHYVANRTKGILNPGQQAVHIQKITGLWSHWKRSFENLNGTKESEFDTRLDEFLWRTRHSKAILQSFCYSVTLLFDV